MSGWEAVLELRNRFVIHFTGRLGVSSDSMLLDTLLLHFKTEYDFLETVEEALTFIGGTLLSDKQILAVGYWLSYQLGSLSDVWTLQWWNNLHDRCWQGEEDTAPSPEARDISYDLDIIPQPTVLIWISMGLFKGS